MSSRVLLAVSLVGAAGAAACGGQLEQVKGQARDAGAQSTPLSEGGSDPTGQAIMAYESGAPMDPGDLGVVSSESGADPNCAEPPATCSTPPGLVEPFSTIDRVYSWVSGKWLFCTGRATWQNQAPSDAIGVEFTPGSSAPTPRGSTAGGNMYYLVKGPSGPVRGAGFNYQLTYDISPLSSSYQFNVHPAPNSGFWLRFKYSACPRELDVMVFYSTTDSVLIPTN
jgi:hypothetical protein